MTGILQIISNIVVFKWQIKIDVIVEGEGANANMATSSQPPPTTFPNTVIPPPLSNRVNERNIVRSFIIITISLKIIILNEEHHLRKILPT